MTSHKEVEEWAAMIAQMQDDPSFHPTYNKKGVRAKVKPEGKEIDYHRYWKDMYEKERKLRQEAEGETTIVKAVGQNSPEMKEAKEQIERLEFKNEKLHKHNEKITKEIFELRQDNKKLAHEIEDRIHRMRKSGM